MKEICLKISNVMKKIFGWGIMLSLFAGGLTFFGYIVAFIAGGETAATICNFIYNEFMPIVIYFTTCMIMLGLVAMYLAGEKALTPTKRKK